MPRNKSVEGRLTRTKGVSLDPELGALAHARANELGMSFSGYVQSLLRRDLQSREKDFVIKAAPLKADTDDDKKD